MSNYFSFYLNLGRDDTKEVWFNFVAIKYFTNWKVPTQKYCIYVLNYSATNFERQEKKL